MRTNIHNLSLNDYLMKSWGTKLPESWTRIRLQYLLNDISETSSSENVVHLTPSVVHGVIPQSELEHQPQQALREDYELLPAQPGDFVVSMSSHEYGLEYCDISGGISPDYTLLRPTVDEQQIDYLRYLFKSSPFIELVSLLSSGIRQGKRIYWSELKNIEIDLPKPEKAAMIASFLDFQTRYISKLIKKKERIVELLEQKRQATIRKKITNGIDEEACLRDVELPWLSHIPEHWTLGKVGWYFDIQLGKMLDENQISGEHLSPYLRNKDVQWWDINLEDLPMMDFKPSERLKYNLQKGDVLVCEGGEIGRSAVWTNDEVECYYQKALHRVRPLSTDQNSRYFCYFMEFAANNGVFTARSDKSTIEHLTAEKLKKQEIPLPPRHEQDQIVEDLDRELPRIAKLQGNIEEQISLLHEKRETLITEAVIGQIDLSDWQPPDEQEALA